MTPKLSLGSQDPTPKKVAMLPISLYELPVETPGKFGVPWTFGVPSGIAVRTTQAAS